MLNRDSFGSALRAYRLKHGLSQRELGERAGISQVHVSKLEAGQCPSVEVADRILSHLGLRIVLGTGRRALRIERPQ